jgi:hypothetical protein
MRQNARFAFFESGPLISPGGRRSTASRLVTQNQDLGFLAVVGTSAQCHPAQQVGEHSIDQHQRHRLIMSVHDLRRTSRSAGERSVSGTYRWDRISSASSDRACSTIQPSSFDEIGDHGAACLVANREVSGHARDFEHPQADNGNSDKTVSSIAPRIMLKWRKDLLLGTVVSERGSGASCQRPRTGRETRTRWGGLLSSSGSWRPPPWSGSLLV